MTTTPSTLVIGPGRLGATLARALDARGWPLAAVAGRRVAALGALAKRLRGEVRTGPVEELDGCYDLVLLAVADDAIGEQAEVLAASALVEAGTVVLHHSGVHGSEVLAPLAARGVATGSMHPLQTFPDAESGLARLAGSHWFCEGDDAALALSAKLVNVLEGHHHVIAAADKALYHASAAIACNYLTVLLDAALETASVAGLPPRDMMTALYPLVRAALDNALQTGPRETLTGPVSRGDVATVDRHLEALSSMPGLDALYRVLGQRAVAIALDTGRIDEALAGRLRQRLGETPGSSGTA